MPRLSEPRFFAFGDFRLDASNHRIYRRDTGELVALTPKAGELLLYLVKNAGRTLTKDELLDEVWGNSFVEEANLSQTVFVLRKALDDDRREPKFILTVPNKGYQFIARIEEIPDELPEIVADTRTEPQDSRTTEPRQRPKMLVIAVGVLAVLSLGSYWLTRPTEPTSIREIRSLAILPFEDLTPEPAEKYLGASLADALATRFGAIRQLNVRPTQSVLKYADAGRDVQEIGRDLQVDAVLEGRIQRSGERLRVSVQLVRTSDKAIIWLENFDDSFSNFFSVQDSISRKVVESISLHLGDDERRRFERRGTGNVEAYQAYLRGRYYWNKRTIDGLQKAISHFEEAARLDPSFALAHTGIADCFQLLPEYSVSTPHEAFPKARAATDRALALDDQLAETHTTVAYRQAFYDWDPARAESSFQRAIELNPNYATAHQWYGELLTATGRFEEAERSYRRALEIDPVSPIILTDLASHYHNQALHDRTIDAARQVNEMEPTFAYAYWYLAMGYEGKGMQAEMTEAIARMTTLFGEPAFVADELKAAFARGGVDGLWQKRIEQIEKLPYMKTAPAFSKALGYVRIGDKDRTMEALNRSFDQRERFLLNAKYLPDLAPMRDDPRFQDLLRRIRL